MLTYWVDESGDVRYAINGQDKGVFFSGVNTALGQLWALIDVYGNTTGVEFVGKSICDVLQAFRLPVLIIFVRTS